MSFYAIQKGFVFFFTICLLNSISSPLNAQSQDGQPHVGEPLPDFLLSDVQYYPEREVTLNTFKGKWLILDFWFKGCVACIKSFPKVDSLQNLYNGQAVFLLVGLNNKMNSGVENCMTEFGLNKGCLFPSYLIPL